MAVEEREERGEREERVRPDWESPRTSWKAREWGCQVGSVF